MHVFLILSSERRSFPETFLSQCGHFPIAKRGSGFVILRKCFTALLFFSSLPDVKMMMSYTHVLNRGGRGVRSPVDSL
jgi:hypothetical protein